MPRQATTESLDTRIPKRGQRYRHLFIVFYLSFFLGLVFGDFGPLSEPIDHLVLEDFRFEAGDGISLPKYGV